MCDQQIFVSYSRKDKDFVNRLVENLIEAGFNIWRDTEAITPGTANWESSIRDAIKNAVALILVASPHSLESDYVQGELSIARHYELPIYPIWASGEDWVNCVPIDLVKTQHVDGRGQMFTLAVTQLEKSLSKLIEVPTDHVKIHLPAHDTLSFDSARYSTFESLLNKTYLFHLNQWYEPYTYGGDWVLGNITTRQLALPWSWIFQTEGEPLSKQDADWGVESPRHYGIRPGESWGIWDMSKFACVGVASNSELLNINLNSEQSIYQIINAYKKGTLRLAEPSITDTNHFKNKIIVGLIGPLAIYGLAILKKDNNFHQNGEQRVSRLMLIET